MALPIPNIDDRKFDDLMAEAISLIPRYNREWTNFNPSDPGIALLEIFAWVSESFIYRADKIPAATYWQFLELIGIGRKEETAFQADLAAGDLLVAGGEIAVVAAVATEAELTLHRALEMDIERPARYAGLHPVACPEPVNLAGLIISNVEAAFAATLQPGHLLIVDGKELAVVEEISSGPAGTIGLYFPVLADVSPTVSIAAVPAARGTGRVRVRGRHIIGEGTRFSDLAPGDLIVAGGRVRVVADIKNDLALTVHLHFDEDQHDAVDFHTVRPMTLSGTVMSASTRVLGNMEDEDLEAAMLRAVRYVTGRYRAVTSEDYEALAGEILSGLLGTEAACRTVCLNNRNFEWGGIGAERPGHVTIMLIVKTTGGGYLQKGSAATGGPEPGRILEAVETGLARRRILTTKIHAVFPRFRSVKVAASLQLVKGAVEKVVRAEAEKRLQEFFDPIGGGPDGLGWPLGRNFYRSEVYQVFEGVSGVDHVLEATIMGDAEVRLVRLQEDELLDLQCTIILKGA
ncbi:MAG: hypothetical protein WC633_01850 [Desulfurivibrionaceae bacterium]|jgi:hypothetical protein